ncbi:hypothetical protein NQ317_017133 [Molorchus minor]|uniref:DNA replication factor RFC1 C-terminal domain-containing protein n=1 Tax=Molorchus minor TaxID=1323400 RepID=A0ABQ9JHB4_9CUCU|nr:hypothetical protein NQ317_017133 [Molorchus minor]
MEVMKSYNLLREDLNNLIQNPFNDVDAKVKSAFTRTYNKEAHLLPFAAGGVSKKKASALDTDLLLEDDENVQSDVEEDDDITADASIKVKTKNEIRLAQVKQKTFLRVAKEKEKN